MAQNSYLIDLGNSNDGPIGLVLRVKAATRAKAINIARAALDQAVGDCNQVEVPVPDNSVKPSSTSTSTSTRTRSRQRTSATGKSRKTNQIEATPVRLSCRTKAG